MARGYLASVEFRKDAGGEMAVYTFSDGAKSLENPKIARTTSHLSEIAASKPVFKPIEAQLSIFPQEAFAV